MYLNLPPKQHQLDALQVSKDEPQFAILADMGTGKTYITIHTAIHLFREGLIDTMVVIAPSGVYMNWIGEINAHLPPDIKGVMAYWKSSARAHEAAELEKLVKTFNNKRLNIILVNVEACQTTRVCIWLKAYMLKRKCLLVIDESTTVANPTAQRTKHVKRLGEFAKYHRILSGSPADNGILKLYSQFDVMRPGMLGYTSFTAFRAHYAVVVDRSTYEKIARCHPKWMTYSAAQIRQYALDPEVINVMRRGGGKKYTAVIRTRNEEELKAALSKVSFIIKKADCLDLPPKVYLTRSVEMSANQRAIYNDMLHRSMIEIEESTKIQESDEYEEMLRQGEVSITTSEAPKFSTALLVITKLLRLTQIACGFVTPDSEDGRPTIPQAIAGPNPLLNELLDVLEQHNGKAFIAANFTFSLEQIAAKLKEVYGDDSTVLYYGGTSFDDREAAKVAFQDPNSPVRWFVANPSVGGYGLTLTQADLMIFFSNDFNREKRAQTEDRIHRMGQLKSCTYVDLIVKNSVFEKIQEVLASKKARAEIITASNWKSWFTLCKPL